jgi:hypothetical protein
VPPVRVADVERASHPGRGEPAGEHKGRLMTALEDGLVRFLDVEPPGGLAQPPVFRASEERMADREIRPGLDPEQRADPGLHPGRQERFERTGHAASQEGDKVGDHTSQSSPRNLPRTHKLKQLILWHSINPE